jgi:hypothetical protein
MGIASGARTIHSTTRRLRLGSGRAKMRVRKGQQGLVYAFRLNRHRPCEPIGRDAQTGDWLQKKVARAYRRK